MEGDDHALDAVVQAVHPAYERVEHRNDQQQTDQFVQQAAQGHLTTGSVLHAGAEKSQYTAADVGADHQADGHVQADHAGTGQGGREQHRSKAGVGNHGEQRAHQGVQQDIAGQRSEDDFDALGMGNGPGGFDDQLQREDDQAQADSDPAQLPCSRLLARQEENHPEEDQQRRQPGQIERQHPRHQGRADVCAKHGGQGRREAHQPLADKRSHQHRGGVTALHHGRHQDTGDKCQPALGHVLPDDLAQIGTVDPQDAGSDDMRAPDKQGHGGKQIEQGQHARPPVWVRSSRSEGKLPRAALRLVPKL